MKRSRNVDVGVMIGGALTLAAAVAFAWRRRSRESQQPGVSALALLRQDHEKVKDLFERYQKVTSPAAKKGIVDEVLADLEIHASLEEELFYPALRRASRDEMEVDRALAEHQQANALIASLQALEADHPEFDGLFRELCQDVREHIAEEESDLFPLARKANLDLRRLGLQMARRRRELKAQVLHPEFVLKP